MYHYMQNRKRLVGDCGYASWRTSCFFDEVTLKHFVKVVFVNRAMGGAAEGL